jgi:hypothetical protein
MADRHVTCTKKDGADPDRRIDRLGGVGFNEHIDTVIRHIEGGVHTYYSLVNGRRANIVVRVHPNGRKYLTTEGDGFPPNNLLQLPNCP